MTNAYTAERSLMVKHQILQRGLVDPRLLAAFTEVPRHLFVPLGLQNAAYEDTPLMIGHGQTISQPYMVALMTNLAELRGPERVLEVGTGSGYQAAILARLVREVHTVELVPALANQAATILADQKCINVHVHQGDGSLGWPMAAPYDAIIVTAAAPKVPKPLVKQLSDAGRLVLPVDARGGYQMLVLVRRRVGEISEEPIASVAFVPLRGRYGVQGDRVSGREWR
jgi:protein-L-isoaspartate(D-aspartate) O-methyltransferase